MSLFEDEYRSYEDEFYDDYDCDDCDECDCQEPEGEGWPPGHHAHWRCRRLGRRIAESAVRFEDALACAIRCFCRVIWYMIKCGATMEEMGYAAQYFQDIMEQMCCIEGKVLDKLELGVDLSCCKKAPCPCDDPPCPPKPPCPPVPPCPPPVPPCPPLPPCPPPVPPCPPIPPCPPVPPCPPCPPIPPCPPVPPCPPKPPCPPHPPCGPCQRD